VKLYIFSVIYYCHPQGVLCVLFSDFILCVGFSKGTAGAIM